MLNEEIPLPKQPELADSMLVMMVWPILKTVIHISHSTVSNLSFIWRRAVSNLNGINVI